MEETEYCGFISLKRAFRWHANRFPWRTSKEIRCEMRASFADGQLKALIPPQRGHIGPPSPRAEKINGLIRLVPKNDFHHWSWGIPASNVLPKIDIDKPYLYLGEAVIWIMSVSGVADTGEAAAGGWDKAERELFDQLSLDESAPVEGYRASDSSLSYRPVRRKKRNIWANMNKGGSVFSQLDEGEETQLGGTIYDGDKRWFGVRLPTSYVLKNWPHSLQTIAAMTDCRKWLETEMKLSLTTRPRAKEEFLREAQETFRISARSFDTAWKTAISNTGAVAWSHAGRPQKSGQ